MQKQVETFDCPPNTQCPPPGTATTGYLRMRMGHGQRYTQMYTTKELQTGEYWDASVSTGLEMYDFDARFYDPQLGRWFVGDPAEQFHNPYLAMGNNPVVYVDPDGEFIHIIVGAAIGGIVNLGVKAFNGQIDSWGDGFAAFGVGALAGGVGAATGGAAFLAAGGAAAGAGGFVAGFAGGAVGAAFSAPIQSIGNNIAFGEPLMTAGEYGLAILGGGVLGGAVNGISAMAHGKTFWRGSMTGPHGNFPITPGTMSNGNGPLKQPNPSNSGNYRPVGDGYEITVGPATPQKVMGNELPWRTPLEPYGHAATIRSISGPTSQSFRSFTYSNFRTNLSRYTGHTPAKSHAHHIFPDEFADDFRRVRG